MTLKLSAFKYIHILHIYTPTHEHNVATMVSNTSTRHKTQAQEEEVIHDVDSTCCGVINASKTQKRIKV